MFRHVESDLVGLVYMGLETNLVQQGKGDAIMEVAAQYIDLCGLYIHESLFLSPRAYRFLGNVFCRLKRFEEAESVLSEVGQVYGEDPDHQEDVLLATRILVGLHQKQGQELHQQADMLKHQNKDQSRTLSEQGYKHHAKAESMCRATLGSEVERGLEANHFALYRLASILIVQGKTSKMEQVNRDLLDNLSLLSKGRTGDTIESSKRYASARKIGFWPIKCWNKDAIIATRPPRSRPKRHLSPCCLL